MSDRIKKFIAILFTPVLLSFGLAKWIVIGIFIYFGFIVTKFIRLFYKSTWVNAYHRIIYGSSKDPENYKPIINDCAVFNRDAVNTIIGLTSFHIVGNSTEKMDAMFAELKNEYTKTFNKDESIL